MARKLRNVTFRVFGFAVTANLSKDEIISSIVEIISFL